MPTIKLNDQIIHLPESRAEFTLGERLKFQGLHGDLLDKMADSILKMEEGIERDLEMLDFGFERMFRVFSFFTGVTVEACRDGGFVEEIAYLYNGWLAPLFEEPKEIEVIGSYNFKGERWLLPEPLLKQGDPHTFGELIDAKQMVRDTLALGQGRWTAVLKLAAIYLRRTGEAYEEHFLYEGSERLRLMEELPMSVAIEVARFFEQFNEFLSTHFDIFRKSRAKAAGPHTRRHYDLYGWVNFLKSIASTKVFDLPGSGLNSIDCARMARAFDVLIYASEDKSLNEAHALDWEEEMRRMK